MWELIAASGIGFLIGVWLGKTSHIWSGNRCIQLHTYKVYGDTHRARCVLDNIHEGPCKFKLKQGFGDIIKDTYWDDKGIEEFTHGR